MSIERTSQSSAAEAARAREGTPEAREMIRRWYEAIQVGSIDTGFFIMIRTVRSSGVSTPAMQRKVSDLPQPEAPRKPSVSWPTSKAASRLKLPKLF